jgi:flagellar protein FlaG
MDDYLDVIVNGEIETDVSVSVVDGELWEPGSVLRVEITRSLDSGDHRVKLIVDGDDEVFRFRT